MRTESFFIIIVMTLSITTIVIEPLNKSLPAEIIGLRDDKCNNFKSLTKLLDILLAIFYKLFY